MSAVEKISQQARKLPEQFQQEVLDFVEFLLSKTKSENTRQDQLDWYDYSLKSAMRGIEDEQTISYNVSDLKERWE